MRILLLPLYTSPTHATKEPLRQVKAARHRMPQPLPTMYYHPYDIFSYILLLRQQQPGCLQGGNRGPTSTCRPLSTTKANTQQALAPLTVESGSGCPTDAKGSDMLANSCPFFASLRAISTRVNVYVRFDLANVKPAPPALIGSGMYGVSLCGTQCGDRSETIDTTRTGGGAGGGG